MFRLLLIASVSLLLSGCALFSNEGPGMSAFTVAADGSIEWSSGKEYGHIKGCFARPDGAKGYIEASDVKAFEGQQILLAMQKQQLDMLSGVIERLAGAAGPMMSSGAERADAELTEMPLPADPCVALFTSEP